VTYREEVDGLRAVAVLAVIAHHFSADALPGGFLGVDIFFVISGYVITLSLVERPQGSLGDFLLNFYTRRIKRIVPPLVLMIAATVAVGSLFIPNGSDDYQRSMHAGIAAAFGVSNIYFYLNAVDYFGSSAELNLFTHTWSLGVEEQFYLIFPVLFWVLAARRALLPTILALAAASIALWVWRSSVAPDEAYFSVLARFWELALGCIVALTARTVAPTWAAYPSAAAVAAAFIMPPSLMLYSTPLAVAGTSGLILSLREGNFVYRTLSFGPVVFVGLVSYSLYLWHWPVLAIARWTVGVDAWTVAPLLCLIMALALASYFLVEKPLRKATWSASRPVSIAYGIASAAIVSAVAVTLSQGALGNLYRGEPAQLIASGVSSLKDKKYYNGQLQWDPAKCVLDTKAADFPTITMESCELAGATDKRRRFLVIGNSYSAAMYEMYAPISNEGFGAVTSISSWGASEVPELINKNSPWVAAIRHYWDDVFPRMLSQMKSGDFLVMINDNGTVFPNEEIRSWYYSTFERGLTKIIQTTAEKEVNFIYLTQSAEMRSANCTPDMAKVQWFERQQHRCKFRSSDETRELMAPLNEMLNSVASRYPNLHILDLSDIFCDAGAECGMFNAAGVPLYRDHFGHPSVEANILARPILLDLIHQIDEKRRRSETTNPLGAKSSLNFR